MLVLLLHVTAQIVAQSPIVLEGAVPLDGGDYFDLAFEVPDGTTEIQVSHHPLDDGDRQVLSVDPSRGNKPGKPDDNRSNHHSY